MLLRKLFCLVAFAAILFAPSTGWAGLMGTAQDFAVLGGSGITVAGAVNTTTITGDIGTFPTATITGLENVVLGGVNHAGDGSTQQAKSDLTKAYNGLAGLSPTSNLTGQNLGGLTLTSGVYKFDSSAQLTGTLTLNAQGNDNAYWVFQIGTALTTDTDSSVVMTNLANYGDNAGLFWQVGSSATLGTRTAFEGNILALTSITLNTDATIWNGRALAQNGAVTLDYNVISRVSPPTYADAGFSGGLAFDDNDNVVPVPVPVPGALLLGFLGMGAAGLKLRRLA